jgi:hypothetical protein
VRRAPAARGAGEGGDRTGLPGRQGDTPGHFAEESLAGDTGIVVQRRYGIGHLPAVGYGEGEREGGVEERAQADDFEFAGADESAVDEFGGEVFVGGVAGADRRPRALADPARPEQQAFDAWGAGDDHGAGTGPSLEGRRVRAISAISQAP